MSNSAAWVDRLMPVDVLERRVLTNRVFAVRLQARDAGAFRWEPGQHVELSTARAKSTQVPYSIASAPDKARPGEFELAVSVDGSRDFSSNLHAGAELFAARPRGTFVWTPAAGATLLIGIGTGVAPLRAMLQSALCTTSQAPITLLCGMREEGEILWRSEFQELAQAGPRFRFEPTLSRASASWTGRRGRVQDQLTELVSAAPGLRAYVCGKRDMVAETVQLLTRRFALLPQQIWSEGF